MFALLTAAMPLSASDVVLVEDGQSQVSIVLESNYRNETYTAAQDLAHYLSKISGAAVPIVNAGDAVTTPGKIYLGRDHANLQNDFSGVNLNLSGYEETLFAAQGNNVLLAGMDGKDGTTVLQHGTSQAIYTFIENQLGVRWLWPGELGEDVPQRSTIAINSGTEYYTPPLEQRYLRLLGYNRGIEGYRGQHSDANEIGAELHEQANDWRRRHRADYRWVSAGHAFTDWWDKYGESNPEYFALQPNGTRNPYPSPDRAKLEIANPDVAEQWLEDAIRQFTNKDYLRMVTASPNDSGYQGYSVDPIYKEEGWDPEEGPMITLRWAGHSEEHVALTDRYAKFWNILARGLKEEFPDRDVFVGTWAYEAYRTPPVETQLEDNIMVGYIGGFPAYDEARRAEERANWEGWSEQTDYLFWRPNLFYFDRGMPVNFMSRSAEDMSWLADHNMRGIDMDAIYGHWSIQGLQYYLMAKLAWDPYLDLDEALNDYTTRAFGSASAPTMRQYFELLEHSYYDRVEDSKDMDSLQRIATLPDFYTQEFLDELQTLLNQAKSQVSDPDQADLLQERIDFVGTGLQFTKLQVAAIAAMNDLRDNATRDTVMAALRAAMLRDLFLDAEMDSFSLNTVWGFDNWASNSTLANYFGPPEDYILYGDANNDGQVDGDDLLMVEQSFGNLGPTNGLLFGDANDDGQVDGDDLLAVEQNFGAVLNIFTAVPEPSTLALLGAGAGLMLVRRRRRPHVA